MSGGIIERFYPAANADAVFGNLHNLQLVEDAVNTQFSNGSILSSSRFMNVIFVLPKPAFLVSFPNENTFNEHFKRIMETKLSLTHSSTHLINIINSNDDAYTEEQVCQIGSNLPNALKQGSFFLDAVGRTLDEGRILLKEALPHIYSHIYALYKDLDYSDLCRKLINDDVRIDLYTLMHRYPIDIYMSSGFHYAVKEIFILKGNRMEFDTVKYSPEGFAVLGGRNTFISPNGKEVMCPYSKVMVKQIDLFRIHSVLDTIRRMCYASQSSYISSPMLVLPLYQKVDCSKFSLAYMKVYSYYTHFVNVGYAPYFVLPPLSELNNDTLYTAIMNSSYTYNIFYNYISPCWLPKKISPFFASILPVTFSKKLQFYKPVGNSEIQHLTSIVGFPSYTGIPFTLVIPNSFVNRDKSMEPNFGYFNNTHKLTVDKLSSETLFSLSGRIKNILRMLTFINLTYTGQEDYVLHCIGYYREITVYAVSAIFPRIRFVVYDPNYQTNAQMMAKLRTRTNVRVSDAFFGKSTVSSILKIKDEHPFFISDVYIENDSKTMNQQLYWFTHPTNQYKDIKVMLKYFCTYGQETTPLFNTLFANVFHRSGSTEGAVFTSINEINNLKQVNSNELDDQIITFQAINQRSSYPSERIHAQFMTMVDINKYLMFKCTCWHCTAFKSTTITSFNLAQQNGFTSKFGVGISFMSHVMYADGALNYFSRVKLDTGSLNNLKKAVVCYTGWKANPFTLDFVPELNNKDKDLLP